MPGFIISSYILTDPPTIRPVGIGDLKVVKQVLAKYEAGEVAHIENVLEGELRSREHRRLRQLEDTITVETISEEESEKDLQSTERFELQTETETVIKSETKFEAGLNLSARYGPVQIAANTDFSMNYSKEQSDRSATTYAKEVSEKAVSRLTESVREKRVARVLQEFEEKNMHSFQASTQRISGVYRWVDKYYRVKVVNYGRRLFYQFYIPGPAAFYLKAKDRDLATSLPTMPLAPEVEHPDTGVMTALSPELIQRDNYLTLIKQYDVQDVEPPPSEDTIVGKAIARELQQDDSGSAAELALGEEIQIPNDYLANTAYGYCAVSWSTRGGDAAFFFGKSDVIYPVPVGDQTTVHDYREIYLGESEDQIFPISINGRYINSFVINIEILCRLRAEAFERWQINTYNAIMTAYHRKMMEFEDKMAAAEVSGSVQRGQNPNINREIEKQELKRACISLWSGYALGSVPGIIEGTAGEGPASYPVIDRDAAVVNAYAMRFFEEAFEWENMTYEFLPYFWRNNEKWIETYTLKTDDPLFEQFLRAGAADVKIPVRPSYTAVVLYYQLTGSVWLADPHDVPSLSDFASSDEEAQLYNNYLAEMEEVEDVYEEDVGQVIEISPDDEDSFLIKVPTSLVWLQPGNELPDNEPDT